MQQVVEQLTARIFGSDSHGLARGQYATNRQGPQAKPSDKLQALKKKVGLQKKVKMEHAKEPAHAAKKPKAEDVIPLDENEMAEF